MARKTKRQLIDDILAVIVANDLYVSGELWITLIFRTRKELVKICQELNIPTNKG